MTFVLLDENGRPIPASAKPVASVDDWRLATPAGHVLPLLGPFWTWDYATETVRFVDCPRGLWRLELVGPFDAVTRSIPVELSPGKTITLDLQR